jgi:hypothetical protein
MTIIVRIGAGLFCRGLCKHMLSLHCALLWPLSYTDQLGLLLAQTLRRNGCRVPIFRSGVCFYPSAQSSVFRPRRQVRVTMCDDCRLALRHLAHRHPAPRLLPGDQLKQLVALALSFPMQGRFDRTSRSASMKFSSQIKPASNASSQKVWPVATPSSDLRHEAYEPPRAVLLSASLDAARFPWPSHISLTPQARTQGFRSRTSAKRCAPPRE